MPQKTQDGESVSYSVNSLIRDISNTVASGWNDIQVEHTAREIKKEAARREDQRISFLERSYSSRKFGSRFEMLLHNPNLVVAYLDRTPIDSEKALNDFILALQVLAYHTAYVRDLLVLPNRSEGDRDLFMKIVDTVESISNGNPKHILANRSSIQLMQKYLAHISNVRDFYIKTSLEEIDPILES